MPFFTGLSEAERYAKSRPYFHPFATARAMDSAGIEGTFPLALDVACGTGQSTLALSAIARHVIGLDISWNMLANAERNEHLLYVQARAEAMPFPNDLVPVLSCALALHWFDRDQFLREAWRVLSLGGLLLVYTNGFRGIMRENLAFQDWAQVVYPGRYPTPPRDSNPLTPHEATASGFVFIGEEHYENDVIFTPEELVAYLTTQTNVAATIGAGRESLETANHWLLEQVRPFFVGASATFVFSSRAWYLKKEAAGYQRLSVSSYVPAI